MRIDIAPRTEPEALVYLSLCEVEVVLSAQHVLHARSVAERELRRIEVHRPAVLLGIDESLSRTVAQHDLCLRSAYLSHVLIAVGSRVERCARHLDERKVAGWLVTLRLQRRVERESPVGLVHERELLTVVEVHLVNLLRAERHEHVVLVMNKELVGRRHYVVTRLEDDVALRELERHILLCVERVGELAAVVVVLRLGSVGVVAVPEEVIAEISRGTTAQAEAPVVDKVVRDDGRNRSDVELRLGAH